MGGSAGGFEMILQSDYEEHYREHRNEARKMTAEELEKAIGIMLPQTLNPQKLNPNPCPPVIVRACKDELAFRFGRQSIQDQIGYDS
jgi:hypothetical protein